jgi:hypothetical protein
MYAHKCAMNMMRFHPEIWHDAALYLQTVGKTEEAVSLLKSSIAANPKRYF